MNKIDWKEIKKRGISILLTAGIAAGFAFLQNLAAHAGIQCAHTTTPQIAGAFGAIMRGTVEVFNYS